MLVEVRLLGKGACAPGFGALVGSAVCVDSQMVEEIVPLAKVLQLILVRALSANEQSQNTPAVNKFLFQNQVPLKVGDLFLNPHL